MRFLDSRNSSSVSNPSDTYPANAQRRESGQSSQVSDQDGEEFDDLPW